MSFMPTVTKGCINKAVTDTSKYVEVDKSPCKLLSA